MLVSDGSLVTSASDTSLVTSVSDGLSGILAPPSAMVETLVYSPHYK